MYVLIELRGSKIRFGQLASQRDNIPPDLVWVRPGLDESARGGDGRAEERLSLDSKADQVSAYLRRNRLGSGFVASPFLRLC